MEGIIGSIKVIRLIFEFSLYFALLVAYRRGFRLRSAFSVAYGLI